MGHHDLATDTIEERLRESESVIARERANQMSLLRNSIGGRSRPVMVTGPSRNG